MKYLTKQTVQTIVAGLVLPLLLLLTTMDLPEPSETVPTKPQGSKVTLPRPEPEPTQLELPLFLPVLHNEQMENWNMEEYILGVLLSEMPASFEMEALKAQAVAARTYALKCHFLGYKHMGAICTQSTCCQGYRAVEDYLADGGNQADLQKLRKAVEDTDGEVLVYDGELIVATYFSCSGGSTEDAAAVWGQAYPYLQAVESPGEEQARYYRDEKVLTPDELLAALGVTIDGEPDTWIGAVSYTNGAGVEEMEIGGVSYRGTKLRKLLKLRSTSFAVSYADGVFSFSTMGYGHRVGMSQYGAEAMAVAGSNYREILQYYYQGTEIVQYQQFCP